MKTKFLFPLLIIIILITSCASKEKPVRERDETFVADVPGFVVKELPLYAAFGLSSPKIYNFKATFYPRTNYLYVSARIGIDVIEIGFSYKERMMLKDAKEKYIELYSNGLIENKKPNKKNAFASGTVEFNWGTSSPSRSSIVPYYVNTQYILDNKPYSRLFFEQTKESNGGEFSSPRISIYISPSQWEKIVEACNQERLIQMSDEILKEAEDF
ncbi:MAG: hypothetical protein J5726_00245 [Treponema sp.]|nr:hypothetical protein [Treponema sp.]